MTRERLTAFGRVATLAGIYCVALLSLRGAFAQDRAFERGSGTPGNGASALVPDPHSVSLDTPGAALERTTESVARVCVAEAGWDLRTGDCAAIAWLLRRRAARLGVSVDVLVRRYSTRHFDEERTDARRWIVGLTLAATVDGSPAPEGWPRSLEWPPYRRALGAAHNHVRGVLVGDIGDPCRGEAAHWGARFGDDVERARRAGWRLLECSGRERNAFWSVR
jgi:hypothetical protein